LLANESLPDAEPSEARRAQSIDVIARALSAKLRRRARRVWASGLVAMAVAGVLGYLGVQRFSSGGQPTVTRPVSAIVKPSGSGTEILNPAGPQRLVGAAALQPGGSIVAGDGGGATVQLSTGTLLAVEHDTHLAFENAGMVQRFFLSRGALQAKVAKLADGQRFIVRTPDAEVEVRGTVFRVAISDPAASCAGGARTQVSVSEGVVEVRSAGASVYVRPGETWPANCARGPASALGATHVMPPQPIPALTPKPGNRVIEVEAPNQAAERRAAAVSEQAGTEASSLARQNQLFADAVAARRRGDSAGAISAFELLTARFPSSPLSESAAVQRMNLLQGLNPTAARAAARQYLVRYPRGYAKDDAEKLLAQP
jgi:ferric-dicitrate binding protein FerR (iron transport regulator)